MTPQTAMILTQPVKAGTAQRQPNFRRDVMGQDPTENVLSGKRNRGIEPSGGLSPAVLTSDGNAFRRRVGPPSCVRWAWTGRCAIPDSADGSRRGAGFDGWKTPAGERGWMTRRQEHLGSAGTFAVLVTSRPVFSTEPPPLAERQGNPHQGVEISEATGARPGIRRRGCARAALLGSCLGCRPPCRWTS